MNKHVTKLSIELAEAREKLRRAESRSGSSSDDEDTNRERNRERPSEDVVERMEEKLEAAQADQKNLFLIIFQVRNKLNISLKIDDSFFNSAIADIFKIYYAWNSYC